MKNWSSDLWFPQPYAKNTNELRFCEGYWLREIAACSWDNDIMNQSQIKPELCDPNQIMLATKSPQISYLSTTTQTNSCNKQEWIKSILRILDILLSLFQFFCSLISLFLCHVCFLLQIFSFCFYLSSKFFYFLRRKSMLAYSSTKTKSITLYKNR